MPLPREQSAGYLVNHLGRQFAVLLANRLKPLGLAPAQHAVLLALWQEDGLSQRELVNILEIRQATAANTLDRMERGKRICLTAKARALEDEVTGIAREINANALAALDEHERGQFLEMLKRLIEQQRTLTGGEEDAP